MDQLMFSYGPQRLGASVTKRAIARWISATIQLCHTTAGKPLTVKAKAHSTRAISYSAALFAGVPLDKICPATTWKSTHTCTLHYCLDSGYLQ